MKAGGDSWRWVDAATGGTRGQETTVTTAQHPATADIATGRRGSGRGVAPATVGRIVLWSLVVVNFAVVEAVFLTSSSSRNPLIAIGKFIGLHLALLMALQLVLIARIPWLDRRIGMDRLTSWHRWTGFAVFWAVVLHPTFILLGYSRLEHLSVWTEITRLAAMINVLTGMIAAVIVVTAVAFSVRFARRRLSYETWHTIHVFLYAAVVLALIHQLLETTTLRTSPWVFAYWWTLWGLAIGALVIGRVVVPLRRNARHGLRVAAVVPESDNVVSVYVTGRDLDRLRARAGQFFIWRFLGHNRWWQANPFSLSAAPDGQRLRLTAKAVGSTSAGLRTLRVGTRVFAEGPYGAFTTMHRSRPATLLIAGGVGHHPGPGAPRGAHRTGGGALPGTGGGRCGAAGGAADPRRAARCPDPPAAGANQRRLRARSSRPTCARLVPDVADRDVFVCGPAGDDRGGAAQPPPARCPPPAGARGAVQPRQLTARPVQRVRARYPALRNRDNRVFVSSAGRWDGMDGGKSVAMHIWRATD